MVKKTHDALDIFDELFVKNDPEMQELINVEEKKTNIAIQLYERRKDLGITQSELAKRAGTKTSVISRMENADYDAHSSKMLHRIAQALGCKLNMELIDKKNDLGAFSFPEERIVKLPRRKYHQIWERHSVFHKEKKDELFAA